MAARKKHGGTRKGAGRKAKYGAPLVERRIGLPGEVWEVLEAEAVRCGCSRNELVLELLRKAEPGVRTAIEAAQGDR